jgi:hypothetical protein
LDSWFTTQRKEKSLHWCPLRSCKFTGDFGKNSFLKEEIKISFGKIAF